MNASLPARLGSIAGSALLLVGPAQPSVAASPPASAVIRQVADAYARTFEGVIGFRTHAVVRSGERLLPRDQVDDGWFVYDGLRLVRSGGVLEGAAAAEAAAHQPYDPRYLGEYTYTAAPCTPCAPGTVDIGYDGRVHDALHAAGVITVDVRTARILSIVTRPYVVPKPARKGSLQTAWGATAVGWAPISTTGLFLFRVGPFTGNAALAQQFTGYRRFEDAAAAERAFPSTR
jgi:hypothetical protein